MVLPLGLQPRLHSWTCDEFNRMAQAGVWEDLRMELIDGAIVDMSPIGIPHSGMLMIVGHLLQKYYNSTNGYLVRFQLPLMLDDATQPQPDLAVVTGTEREFLLRVPTAALIVVEIAESSLGFDRGIKSERYAEADIEEYWIVNLIDTQLEVYRRVADTVGFAPPQIVRPGDQIIMPALSNVTVAVADLLP